MKLTWDNINTLRYNTTTEKWYKDKHDSYGRQYQLVINAVPPWLAHGRGS